MSRASGTAAHLPALARLIRHTDRWLIAWHADGPWWSAERQQGRAVRYLCAHDLDGLADRIDRVEAGQ